MLHYIEQAGLVLMVVHVIRGMFLFRESTFENGVS